MKTRLVLALAAIVALAFAAVPFALRSQHAGATVSGLSVQGLNRVQNRLLSGFASFQAGIGMPARPVRARVGTSTSTGTKVLLCPGNLGSNVLVNLNCLTVSDPTRQGSGQAENQPSVAQNPENPLQIVTGFNDYRRGDGVCYGSISRNGGASWRDTSIPMGFTGGAAFGGATRQYWQAGGDASVAWDTRGNAYLACQVFMRGQPVTSNPDQSSAIYVFRSTRDAGASWDFPGRPAVENFSNSGVPLSDRPYMTIDDHAKSPFRDRIYVTWTSFAADGTAYIYEVHSNDYGQTFSSPVPVSTTSSLCTNTLGLPTPQGSCNENQYSDPFTAPDGTLYVVYDNFNNSVGGSDNHNQVLLVKSTDGGQTFGAPVLVGKYYDLPDCGTYQGGQDPFRSCVPEKGSAQNSVFLATNYPSGAVNPKEPREVAVTFGSYVNRDSREPNGCVPAGLNSASDDNLYTGVKTAGACNNKILLSLSTNHGASFTGTTTGPRRLPVVNTAPGQKRTDQWWQWAAFTPGGTLAVSYYDRQYGSDEKTGRMDVSASTASTASLDAHPLNPAFRVRRATSASMPLPTQFPDGQGNGLFFGDHSGLAAWAGVHPVWMDTRDLDAFVCSGTGAPGVPPALCTAKEPNGRLANDEEIYTIALSGS